MKATVSLYLCTEVPTDENCSCLYSESSGLRPTDQIPPCVFGACILLGSLKHVASFEGHVIWVANSVGTPMFGNVTALEGLHVTGKYRDRSMHHTCSRHAAWNLHMSRLGAV